jgi:predicted double-glycine peptidase
MDMAKSFCINIKLNLGVFLLVVAISMASSRAFATGLCQGSFETSLDSSGKNLPVRSIIGLSMAPSIDLIKVPRLRQATDYTCGVCALQAVLAYYGDDVREDVLSRALKANPRDGTRYQAIADYSRKQGYNVAIKKDAELQELEAILKSGLPAICLIQAWAETKSSSPGKKIDYASDWQDGHYVVAVGFDKDNFYFMDPSTVGTYTYIQRNDFLERWHDTDGHEKLHHFIMVISKEKPYDPEAITEIK